MRLFVRISQRSCGGNAPSGMVVMALPLKATISREQHLANGMGNVANLQLEKNAILRLTSRCKSSGN